MSTNHINRRKFTITWKIQNYSSFYFNADVELKSPIITAGNLDNSQWGLSLSRGYYESDKEYMSCFLHRLQNDQVNSQISLSFKIEISSPQGAVLHCRKLDDKINFKIGEKYGFSKFMDINKFFKKFENWFEDTLTVRCHMVCEIRKNMYNECEIFTQFNVDQISYRWNLKIEDSSGWIERKNFLFFGSSNLKITLTCPEDDLIIKINKDTNTSPYYLVTGKISLLDIKGSKRHSQIDAHFFGEPNNSWNFPNFLTKTRLKAEEDTIPFDGILIILLFEFSISNGIAPVGSRKYTCGTIPDYFDSVNALHKDMLDMLANQKHCDVKLRADNLTLSAHKSVLAARSPVFSAMFDQDMLENREGFVNLPDLDGMTLKLFLVFLYTGKLDNIDHESALNLLVIADKYDIQSLKEICATLLIPTLSERNVCEVFTVSDMIGYSFLRESALNHILANSRSVLSSQEWSQWVEKNVKLATEIFSKLAVQFGAATNISMGETATDWQVVTTGTGASAAVGNPGASAAVYNSGASAAMVNPGASAAMVNPGASAVVGNPGVSAAVGNPGASAPVGNPGASAAVGNPGAYAAVGNPGAYAAVFNHISTQHLENVDGFSFGGNSSYTVRPIYSASSSLQENFGQRQISHIPKRLRRF